MRFIVFLLLFLVGALVVAYPRMLVAEKLKKQYRHAADILRQGDLEGAQREFEEFLHANPEHEKAKILLGLAHYLLGQKAEQTGDRTRAISELQEALGLQPDEAYWHSALAELLAKQGDVESAAQECAQAAKLSPYDSGLASGCGLNPSPPPDKERKEGLEKEGESQAKTLKVEGEISAPVAKYMPEPPCSKKAILVGHEGVTLLNIVVNAQGTVEKTQVVRHSGLGLDQKALETVRTWKFTPAMRNGMPLPVRVTVEVTFRMK